MSCGNLLDFSLDKLLCKIRIVAFDVIRRPLPIFKLIFRTIFQTKEKDEQDDVVKEHKDENRLSNSSMTPEIHRKQDVQKVVSVPIDWFGF